MLGSALYAGCGGSDSEGGGAGTPGGSSGLSGAAGANAAGTTGTQGGAAGSVSAGAAGSASGQSGSTAAGSSGSSGQTAAGASGSSGQSGAAGAAGGSAGAGGTTGGAAGSTAGTGGSAGGGQVDPIVGLVIEPESPVIEVVDGVIPAPVEFKVKTLSQGGTLTDVTGQWDFDTPDIAKMVPATGVLTATGLHGGKGQVSVKVGDQSVTTTLTIKMKLHSDPGNLGPGLVGSFDGATSADPSLAVVYPYDQTVFPRGLLGPELQWNGGGASDVYRLRIASDTFEYEAFFNAAAPSRYAFPTAPVDVWTKLTTSVTGALQMNLQRWDGTQAYQGKNYTWRVASANLAGTIYYTALAANGDILRLTPGASAPESFLKPSTPGRCIACHTVSSNGQRIVAGFDGGASPWGVFDAATGNQLYDSGQASGFQAMSPNGDFVLWRHWSDGGFNSEGALRLSTSSDSNVLATLQTDGVHAPSHPAWSHDGTRLALSTRFDGNGLDFTSSNLWLTNVTTSPPQFSDVKKIIDNDASRPTVTFPSFSPDSKWIAFMRATMARTQSALGELWLTDGNGTAMPLDALNGTGYLGSDPNGDAHRSFEPSFLPLASGGYFWVVFSTTRAYGNHTGTGNRLQLWVAAIEQNPQPGQDPSHPAFWLPGQNLASLNMRGQWARAVCKPTGATCEAGYDCCDGFCLDSGQGPVCATKPAGCSPLGSACQTSDDCCTLGNQCINGFCSQDKPLERFSTGRDLPHPLPWPPQGGGSEDG